MRSANLLAVSFVLFTLGLFAFCPAFAQSRTNATGTGGIHEIRGRVFLPDGRSPELPVRIELQSMSNFSTLTVETDRNGSYSFRGLAPGNYSVVVNAGEMFEPFRDSVTIDTEVQINMRTRPTPMIANVPVNLQSKQAIVRRAAVINAKLASIPKTATSLYEKAQQSIAAREFDRAKEELRQAIATYNAFSLAWNDLGVLLEKAGDEKGALEAFRSAVRYDNTSTAAILNLGCSLADAKEYAEAEKYLAVALSKDGSLYRGHVYLGIVEAKLGRLDIAEQAFLKAIELGGTRASRAHFLLAGVYWSSADFKRAADHLEAYLKLEPNAKDAEKTREAISELRRKQKGLSKPSGSNSFS
ncbi:MAG TPA: tetratricopeptide repeat protein [Pyrinomonadaceae bacterium]